MDIPTITERTDKLFLKFSEPVIQKERIARWLEQFPVEDRSVALTLLELITFHSYPALIRESRDLHTRINKQLEIDGFDIRTHKDVDFSREFTCKSGDLISYIYRKANAIPSVDFKNFDRLINETRECTGQFCNRALVILDDYIGTGSQFIFQFIARSDTDIQVINNYKKVYLAAVVIHDNAFEKLALLQKGEYEKVLSIEESQFPDYDWAWEKARILEGLCKVDWHRIGFLFVEREHPLLAMAGQFMDEKKLEQLVQFMNRYGGDTTLTTSYLAGHHAFFYGAPNSLPKVLYPLFGRVEDLSIYPTEHFIGVPVDIVDWKIDNCR